MNTATESKNYLDYLTAELSKAPDNSARMALEDALYRYTPIHENIVSVELGRAKALLLLSRGLAQVAQYSGVEAI